MKIFTWAISCLKAQRGKFNGWFDRQMLRGQRMFWGSLILVSFLVAVAAVVGSFFIPTKVLGVAVSSVGCFIAGALFSIAQKMQNDVLRMQLSKEKDANTERVSTLKKELEAEVEEKKKQLEEVQKELKNKEDEYAKEKEKKAAELVQANNKIKTLTDQNDRLKHQCLNIDSVKQIFEVNFAEFGTQITDFKEEWVGPIQSNLFGWSLSRQKYIGVMRTSFTMKIGIDLNELRFYDDGERIHVSPIRAKNNGIVDSEKKWLQHALMTVPLVRQDLESGDEGNGPSSFVDGSFAYKVDDNNLNRKVSLDMNAMEKYCQQQEKEVDKRINKGNSDEFKAAHQFVTEKAEKLIEAILKPTRKPIVFDLDLEQLPPTAKDFHSFAQNHNEKLLE